MFSFLLWYSMHKACQVYVFSIQHGEFINAYCHVTTTKIKILNIFITLTSILLPLSVKLTTTTTFITINWP